MFKVPEWGDDVPKMNINFQKTNLKKAEKKLKIPPAKDSPVKDVNGISKKQSTKKSTDKRKLKKRRQKNREIYQRLSNSLNITSEISSNDNQPGRFVLNPNRLEPVEHVENKEGNIKPKKLQKQKNKKQKQMANGKNNEIKKSNKRKLENPKKNSETDNMELKNLDIDEADELILNAKKKKLDEAFKNEDREDVLFSEKPKISSKKEHIKKVLEKANSNRNSVDVSGNNLRERMLAKLQAAQFRYLNEKLYTSSGTEAKELFRADPAAFETYHQGYQQQIKKWPINPLDVIVKRIMKMPKTHAIADMGCGSATLSKSVPHKVRSFDLVASAPGVEVCDMAHTPLLSGSMDVVVYCLALMGTELGAYLAEGNRVLKTGRVEKLGFKLVKADQSHQVFHFLEFRKTQEAPKKAKHLQLTLKPCLYKRR
ncbi:hypothetical protein MSG28_001337 [Choristoneura fumiferana]|uniref:Uncharacterized protein n=1 Tax=Choristoneura fumiferana TaxID=7141 RepID=A0ACC0KU69_CHOFU|nr:hypothetical protein MSG28_001337 [Choristoneura fumiferana]